MRPGNSETDDRENDTKGSVRFYRQQGNETIETDSLSAEVSEIEDRVLHRYLFRTMYIAGR